MSFVSSLLKETTFSLLKTSLKSLEMPLLSINSPSGYLTKDLKRVRYRCTNKDCPWTVNAHLNKENKNEVIVDKVTSKHTCIGNEQAKRGAASCQEWIQKVIARHMDVKRGHFSTTCHLPYI
jgi:hypothetical protein